jgi:HEAT repeat protein
VTGNEAVRTGMTPAPRRRIRHRPVVVAVVSWWLVSCWPGAGSGLAQAPSGLAETITELGDFDYAVRMDASRRIRRLDRDFVAPLLAEAAHAHGDSYVQFRAAVLLSGIGGPPAREFFRQALEAPNDRVRAAAYEVAEHDPDPALAARLLASLDRETSEFVRPSLLRALAAHDGDPAVREQLVRDIDRGEGFFRATVIEALGERRAGYAVDALIRIASAEGPLRDDALVALGRIGDERALPVIAAAQDDAANTLQPIVSASACLLGIDCANQARYVVQALEYATGSGGGDQVLLRAAATAAGALAAAGRTEVLEALIATGVGAVDPARAPLALALGSVALRDPAGVLEALAGREDLEAVLLLLRDAFDMLDEDLAEERFYVSMQSTFWDERQIAGARAAAEAAMRVLEF